ncbi:MAG: helix-turn-helix domain-containing protein [Microthrixaceae bacterium]
MQKEDTGRRDPGEPDEVVLTGTEAAELLRVSVKTVLRLARKGDIPGRKVGREWRFARADVLAWLSSAA